MNLLLTVVLFVQATQPATSPTNRNPAIQSAELSPPANLHGHVMEAIGGELFVFGGYNPARQPGNENPARGWRGDLDGKQWRQTAAMPTPRTFAASAVLEKRIVVLGGLPAGSRRYSTAVEAYDPTSDRWEKLPELPAPLSRFGAAVVRGRLYVVSGLEGGDDGCKTSAAVFEFDPREKTWSRRRDIPHGRHAFAITVLDDRLFVLGGYVDQGERIVPCDLVESYDPARDQWETETPLPSPREWFAAGEHGGGIVVVGALDGGNPQKYDRVGRVWSPLPVADIRDQRFAGVVVGDQFYVSGGELVSGAFLRALNLAGHRPALPGR